MTGRQVVGIWWEVVIDEMGKAGRHGRLAFVLCWA